MASKAAAAVRDGLTAVWHSLFPALMGQKRRSHLQIRAFILTFLAHAAVYLMRKPLSIIKRDLSMADNTSVPQLGWLDVAFLLPQAAIQIFASHLGSELGSRIVIAASLLGCGATMITFGFWKGYRMQLLLLAVSGTLQALVLPHCVRTLGVWFAGQRNSTRFGVWGSSMFAGMMVATLLTVTVRAYAGWRNVFFLPSLLLIGVGALTLRYLRMPSGSTALPHHVNMMYPGKPSKASPPPSPPSPTHSVKGEKAVQQRPLSAASAPGSVMSIDASLSNTSSAEASSVTIIQPPSVELLSRGDNYGGPDMSSAASAGESDSESEQDVYVIETLPKTRSIRFPEIVRMSMVKELALAYFFVNMLRYSLQMWLPLYLESELKHTRSAAAYLSSAYDTGALIGSIVVGILADRYFKGRKVLAAQMALVISAGGLLLFWTLRRLGVFLHVVTLFVMGAGSGGTDIILLASLAMDIGEQADCVGSVAAFIGGFGALGAFAQGPIVASTVRHGGAPGIFFLMIAMSVVPILFVGRVRRLDIELEQQRARLEIKAAQ